MKIWQKIVLSFAVAVLMLAFITVSAYRTTNGLLKTAQLVARSRQVLETEGSLMRHLIEAENSVRGYLLVADEQYLPAYDRAQQEALGDFHSLKSLTASREQLRRLDALQPLISKKFAALQSAITTRRTAGVEAAARIIGEREGQQYTQEMRAILREFQDDAEQTLRLGTSRTNESGRRTTMTIVFAGVGGMLILTMGVFVILRDVAARRRAEIALSEQHNLLSNVIDAMPQHVFVKDLGSRYVIDNEAHRRFLGAQHLRQVEGKTSSDFFPREIAHQFEEDDKSVLTTGTPILNREEMVFDHDGEVIWLSTTKVPLRHMDGTFSGMVCVSSDISKNKEAGERERLITEQLQRSNLELQEFASVASHDLQEPLRKIQAFGDRLMRKCGEAVGEEGRDYLDRMQNAARRMQTLLHDLLTLSRVTSQAKPFESVALVEIVREVVGDLEVRIEQTGAIVEVGYLPTIEADPAQMRQLFQNLISNAMKFQRPGSVPEVIISSKVLEVAEEQLPGASPGDEVCRIMVKDNGIGFDEKYLDRIFIVFQRLHSRSEYEGTGIGLAVCRKILVRHGGIISAKSAEGEGATFIVTLPLKQRMRNDDEEARRTDHDFNGG